MKRMISMILGVTMLVSLTACVSKTDSANALPNEGIAPYQLSESNKHLLQSFGMENNTQIVTFHAPKEANALNVNIYRLENSTNWVSIGGGGISIDNDGESVEQQNGTFAMELAENYAIHFNINSSGRASFKTEEITLDTEVLASTKGFLEDFQEIEPNKEIPIALMVYDDGTSMKSYTLQDYFEPSQFEGMDLVQVVTLTFSDKGL